MSPLSLSLTIPNLRCSRYRGSRFFLFLHLRLARRELQLRNLRTRKHHIPPRLITPGLDERIRLPEPREIHEFLLIPVGKRNRRNRRVFKPRISCGLGTSDGFETRGDEESQRDAKRKKSGAQLGPLTV